MLPPRLGDGASSTVVCRTVFNSRSRYGRGGDTEMQFWHPPSFPGLEPRGVPAMSRR